MSEASYTTPENEATTAAIFEAIDVLTRIGASAAWIKTDGIGLDNRLEIQRKQVAHTLGRLWDERHKREEAARKERTTAQAFTDLHAAADRYGIDLNDPKTFRPREGGWSWFGRLDADRECICGATRKEHADTPLASCFADHGCGCAGFKARA